MDSYDEQHADLRKVLKSIIEQSENWSNELNATKPDPQSDFARKTAMDACQSLHDAAKQMLVNESEYFGEQKKDKKSGQ
jgi:hypothetical protein